MSCHDQVSRVSRTFKNLTKECITRYIKKIKMELGEDKDLKFMMACADYIPPLQAFQGSCKPVWLFVAAGQGTAANKMRTMSVKWRLLRRGCVRDGRPQRDQDEVHGDGGVRQGAAGDGRHQQEGQHPLGGGSPG